MPLAFAVKVDDRAVIDLFQRAPDVVKLRLRQLIEGSAIDIQREMRIAAPVAVTGDLRRSIRYTFSAAKLQAEVGPTVNYADDVESGTKPHLVSVAEGTPLRAWAKLKGINPWALQRSIAKKGTKKHPFVEPTFEKMKSKVEGDIISGLNEMVGGLQDGKL